MCGIVGIVGDPGALACLTFDLSAAVAALVHRGPDDNGLYQNRDRGIYIGHTRLAVIDVSLQARQPMHSATKDFIIAFNGEIYNFKELFLQHCHGDPQVNTNSDTAVLLSLLQRYGYSTLDLLNGMFAFAAVDLRKNEVLLARDRFGEKPLYWMQLPGAVAFASELRTLKALKLLNTRDIDHHAMAIYQAMGSIPPPYTIYRDVYCLQPGSYLIFKNGRCTAEGRYWTLEDCGTEKPGRQNDPEGTLEKLRAAVRSRMVSDVPVGLFLSGGYDSSSILALCQDIQQPPAKILCVDFEEKEFSEYPQAQRIARYFGRDVERCVLTEKDFAEGLQPFFRSMDQPTTDGYNTFFVSRAAYAIGIKVWLSGVGGDEFFGGYPSFRRLSPLSALSRIGQLIVPKLFIDAVTPKLHDWLRWSRFLHMFDKGDADVRAFQYCRQLIPWRNVGALMKASVRKDISKLPELIDSCFPILDKVSDSFSAASILESGVYMRSQLLRDIDNFSMAHSIELRAPFLDHRLYHHVMRLKTILKREPNVLKPLLARSLQQCLPSPFLSGPKRGFTFPVEKWLRGYLKRSFEEIVFDHSNSDFYDIQNIKAMWNAHQRGRIHWSIPWTVFAFCFWRMEQSANTQ